MAVASAERVPEQSYSQEFERIFEEHHDLVYRTAYGVTASVEDAEDIAQTIFLQILRREVSIASMENPAGYLYRAAVNLSLTLIRSRGKVVELDSSISNSLRAPARNTQDEDHRRLYAAIAELPAKTAEILILRYQHNFKEADIARLLGTSRGVIAVTLFRARARLRKLLVGSSGAK